MDKLIENSRLDCPLDQQIKVLERCLQVVTYPGENWQKKEVGWLLLARVLEKCSPECLRAGQSRLGKRLVDIASSPTLSSAVFVRQLLVRNPQTGELHATSVEKIVLALLDEAVRDECSNMSELAAEIFAIRYGNSKSDVLLSTLDVLLRQKFIGSEERQGLLNIGCLGMKQYVVPLTKYLFHLLSVCFEHSRQGELLNRDKFLGIIELGLNSAVARDNALHTLESFCRTAKKAALPVIPLISSMLVSQLKEPSAALFSALAEIAQQYGSSSTLHKHFYVIFEVLKHPLDQQAYGEESGRLIAAIVRTSGFLIQPEILIAVQQAVCRQFALHPNAAVYRKLMTVFLLNTHPLIPPPIHVARSVIKNHSDDQLSSICDLISRPRIMNLDAKRVLEKAVSMKTREENPIQMEVEQVEETVTVTKTITVIPVAEPETLPSPVQEIIEYVIKPSTSKPEKRPNPETKPAPVKKKLKKPELKTVLHEGEQSVDDIFDSFVI